MRKPKTKSNKPDKKVIADIDPVSGVTPEQLHQHCTYFLSTIPASYKLSAHQQQEAINNAVMYTYRHMEAGDVDKYDYQKFKSYLYITTKNEVRKQYQVLNLHYNNFNNNTLEIEDPESYSDHSENTDLDQALDDKSNREKLYNAIKKLGNREQEIIGDYLSGMKQKYIRKKHKVSAYIINKILNQLNNIIFPPPPEMVTLPKIGKLKGQIKEFNPEKPLRNVVAIDKRRLATIFPNIEFIGGSELLRKYSVSLGKLNKKLIPIRKADAAKLGLLITGTYYKLDDVLALNLPLKHK